ncbi:MAG: arginine deiminase family protein [Candidatus Aenigmarchaeota archaeon]|nr:arginine deiminase family protein [Candidatus Aenigmarchaeota archaeon]
MSTWTDYDFKFCITAKPVGDRITPIDHNLFTHYLPPIPESKESIKQYDSFIKRLKENRKEPLEINGLLCEVIRSNKNSLFELLSTKQINLLKKQHIDLENIDVNMLINGYPQDPNEFITKKHIIKPNPEIHYTRDPTIHIPLENNLNGVIIGNMKNLNRKEEPKIMKFIYKYNQRFKDSEIIADFSNTSYNLEGGNIIVFNKNILLVGINERTNESTFYTLLRSLENKNTEINEIAEIFLPKKINFIIHLDNVLNLIRNKENNISALIMPYIFNYPEVPKISNSKKILINILKYSEQMCNKNYGELKKEIMKSGKVMIYKKINKKFRLVKKDDIVNYLKKKGVENFITVGGNLGVDWQDPYKHALIAIKEQNRCANNILSVKPGIVIIFEGSPYTIKTLRDNNFQCEIVKNTIKTLGGPHCMAKPVG